MSTSIDSRRRLRIPLLSRFLTERDPIDQQLEELSRQGSGMARVAHLCATMLVVLFSAGSFVALGSDALHSVLVQWQTTHQLDIPSAISLCVSTLMVLAMDVAMLSAAASLRLLASRRAAPSEMFLHVAVMAGVCILESGTYLYMSWTYEHPATAAAGALIIARALAAPLLAVYLASRRVLPITSRDILAASEIAAGAGVLRDVTTAARDQTAPLSRKMRLYGAAAVMLPHDRKRLDDMIDAVQDDSAGSVTLPSPAEASVGAYTALQEGAQFNQLPAAATSRVPRLPAPESSSDDADGPDDRPPTGPGSPSARGVRTRDVATSKRPAVLRLEPPAEWAGETAAQARVRGSNPRGKRSVRTPRKAPVNHEALARKAWANGATSVERMRRATGMSKAAASSWVRSLKAERDTLSQQQALLGQEVAQ